MIRDHWNKSAADYSEIVRQELTSDISSRWQHYVQNAIHKEGTIELLDVGTGPGIFPVLLADEHLHVTGIDLSEGMIEQAKNNIQTAGVSADVFVRDAADTQFPAASFDVIICRNLVWTLERPVAAYQEWHRLLKPGGQLLIFDGEWYGHHYHADRQERFQTLARYVKDTCQVNVYNYGGEEHPDDHEMMHHLYLSDKKRPDWDISTLETIGFTIEDVHHDYLDDITGKEERLKQGDITPVFFISAIKP
ncbi:class I SAM-dependent methyltransferase [Macrococcus brunensis]|uniref:class I SAM-dependent methyltransferase n=1 Tax=Macrococcus brunensis TaxID=198483 RepID=UPI001EF12B36|nr:class I SAM-dependent methyltransferase [Macrococcus brunensis]ULG72404.1 class I SAM-dependent methyltransferase [Macrococcus brunensis]